MQFATNNRPQRRRFGQNTASRRPVFTLMERVYRIVNL